MSDTKNIRWLETQLADCKNMSDDDPYQCIDVMNDLAWALRDTDLQRAISGGDSSSFGRIA